MAKRKPKNPCTGKNRAGEQCGNPCVPGKTKCYYHGGKSTGPPKGSQNGLTHGFYARGLHKREKERWAAIPLGTIEDELRMARVKLNRAWEAQKKWEEQQERDPSTLDVEGVHETLSQGTDDKGKKIASMTRRTIRRKRDFSDEIAKFTRLVANLEKLRAELLSHEKSEDFIGSVAEKLRAFTEQAEATVPEVAE